jgi:hypothetical protein
MTSDQIKSEILKLSKDEQRQLILDLIKAVMPAICMDDTCLNQIRAFVDESTVKGYRDQHMGNI